MWSGQSPAVKSNFFSYCLLTSYYCIRSPAVVSPAVLFETENPGYNYNKQKRKHLVCEGFSSRGAFHMASVFACVEHPNPYVLRHALSDCAWVPVGSILQSQYWMSCPLTAEYRPGTKLICFSCAHIVHCSQHRSFKAPSNIFEKSPRPVGLPSV